MFTVEKDGGAGVCSWSLGQLLATAGLGWLAGLAELGWLLSRLTAIVLFVNIDC